MADDGFAFLAEVFHDHTSRVTEAAAKSLRLDFGEILEDYSLKPNTYDTAIPKEAWMVCRQLTLGATDAHMAWTVSAGHPGDGTHSHGSRGPHSHSGGRHLPTEAAHLGSCVLSGVRWAVPPRRCAS